MTRHHLFDPDGLPPAVGFSYGAVPAAGRTVYVAGITGERPDGSIADGLVEQFADACRGVARVVEEAGGSTSDVVSVNIYTTDVAAYRASLRELGEMYRAVFGRHYPPTALIGVSELFHPDAVVELVCVAVVPD